LRRGATDLQQHLPPYSRILAPAGASRIVAFNSDSLHLPTSILQSAFELFERLDVVVGPTYDGGYYLMGARRAHPGLFTTAAMGTANALDVLLTHARSLGLSVCLTDPFHDIDVAADLGRLAEEQSCFCKSSIL